ncbi:DUF2341 domain-containing protein [Thermococcus sp. ES12]|uniref:DUF2341 domain-containing protein n=1 Tax=Thermococcus sp. ES12 TaxID=1638246 RepID=UPI0014318AAD|nr:DUF2341 domain-containing protein [Thermococcus sp. ES12]NJE77246.1 DUF2341 domain-containing protein [Thermococcus sp. ES12]
MRKRRAFLMNSTVILLLIPLMLLLATYEDVSSQIIASQSERTQVERTYRIVSYVEMDFQRTLEISGKRAIVTIVDYIANTRDFLDPNNPNHMANATIRDLVILGEADEVASNYSERLMRDQTVAGWLGNISNELLRQGYEIRIANKTATQIKAMSPSQRADFLRQNIELIVAPLDSFRIVIKARIKQVTISDISGTVVYSGPIPREGYVYSIISIENLEDPLFSALTYGRYYRSIEPCEYTFPELIERPVKALYGNGSSDEDHVLGKYSSTKWEEGYLFYGDYYPGDGADGYVLRSGDITSITAPVIVNTTVKGVPISPREIFSDNDVGVLVFGNIGPSIHWCSSNYKWRVNLTIPSFTDGSLVLLQIPTSTFPNIYHTDGQASMMIYEKSDVTCIPVPFWIEYWGTSYVWVWIKASGTDYTIYFTDNPSYATDGYNKEYLFWLIDTFEGTTINPVLWNNLADAYLDGSGHLVVPGGAEKLALQTIDSIDGEFFVRFRMKPDLTSLDFDSGIETEFNYTETQALGDYLKVVINYDGPQLADTTNVQVPIRLSAENVSNINSDPSTNRAEILVYSDELLQNQMPFWIEYWDTNGAQVWVKTNLTYTGRTWSGGWVYHYTATVYIKYNTGTLTRGNGDQVFEFFDDFTGTTIDTGKWDTHGNPSVNNGYLQLPSRSWIWSKTTFPSTYIMDIRGKLVDNPGIMWNIRRSTGWGRIEDINYYNDGRGYLWWFNVLTSNWIGWYDSSTTEYNLNSFQNIEVRVTSSWTDIYQFSDWTNKILRSSYNAGASNNRAIGLEQWNGGPSEYDWLFVRKYLEDEYLDYTITEAPEGTQTIIKTDKLQFIDDNSAFNDHGGDTLAVLENWTNSIVSGNPTVLGDYHRYQVVFTPTPTGVEFDFTDLDSTLRSVTSGVDREISSPVKVGIIIDSPNTAYFDWIVIGRMPYYTADHTEIQSTGVESSPVTSNTYNARAYDLQPLISCIIGQRYFGTYEGISFFERLENSVTNHDKYFQLAKRIQDELGLKYGGEYYPIGLVSFMVPNADYDQKLFEIFNNFGITVEEGQSSVDYYFLNYYFGRIEKKTGYRVWGISYGTSALTGDLTIVPFFMDNQTAAAILGPVGAEDLLKR